MHTKALATFLTLTWTLFTFGTAQDKDSNIFILPENFTAKRSYSFKDGKGFKETMFRLDNLIRLENEMGGGYVILNLSDRTVSVVNHAQRLVMRFKFESSPTNSKIIDDTFLLFGLPLKIENISMSDGATNYLLGGDYDNYNLVVNSKMKFPEKLTRVDENGFWTSVIWNSIEPEKPDSALFVTPSDYKIIEK